MKTTLLIWVLRTALALLLNKTSIKELLALVKEAELMDANGFAKRGVVYRNLKEKETTNSTQLINTLVEMGVMLYRLYTRK